MKFSRSLVIVLVLAALALGSYFFYGYYVGTKDILDQERIKVLQSDRDGGGTPQETINLFVSALKAGDIDKASLYFSVDERVSWTEALRRVKEGEFLDEMATDVGTKSVPDPSDSPDDGIFQFLIKEGEDTVSVIVLELNPYTKVWKIKSI